MLDGSNEGTITYQEPLKDLRTLSLAWEMPRKFAHRPESQPEDVISHSLPEGINHPANLPAIYQMASKLLDTNRAEENFAAFFGSAQ